MSRHGVIGKGIPIEPAADFIEALGDMVSVTIDETGKQIQLARGTDIMGHPLNVVLWLIEYVNAQGRRLLPGGILSLGAMGTFRPAEAGRTITVRYTGLPGGNSEAVVMFR